MLSTVTLVEGLCSLRPRTWVAQPPLCGSSRPCGGTASRGRSWHSRMKAGPHLKMAATGTSLSSCLYQEMFQEVHFTRRSSPSPGAARCLEPFLLSAQVLWPNSAPWCSGCAGRSAFSWVERQETKENDWDEKRRSWGRGGWICFAADEAVQCQSCISVRPGMCDVLCPVVSCQAFLGTLVKLQECSDF